MLNEKENGWMHDERVEINTLRNGEKMECRGKLVKNWMQWTVNCLRNWGRL